VLAYACSATESSQHSTVKFPFSPSAPFSFRSFMHGPFPVSLIPFFFFFFFLYK